MMIMVIHNIQTVMSSSCLWCSKDAQLRRHILLHAYNLIEIMIVDSG